MADMELRNYINGESREPATGARTELVDPSTGEVFATAPLSGADDIDAAYQAASDAFTSWGKTTPSARQKALLAVADVLGRTRRNSSTSRA